MEHPAAQLADLLVRNGSRPLVTFYDDATGERVELSVATFANWVAKTANLLVDGLGLAPGDRLVLDLPRHWQSPVWAVAAWTAGLVVSPGGDPTDSEVTVTGPTGLERALAAPEVVALSLRPLGAPFGPGELPAGVVDYGREVAAHGDRFAGPPLRSADPALRTEAGTRTATQVVQAARSAAQTSGLHPGGRLLLAAACAPELETLLGAAAPLALDGSVVLCRHPEAERLPGRVVAERITAELR